MKLHFNDLFRASAPLSPMGHSRTKYAFDANPTIHPRHTAFSLIELLVVAAVLALVAALAIPAFVNVGKTQLLNAEGNKIMGLISRASQNSVARNAMTALIAVPDDASSGNHYNQFALFQYAAGDTAWKQISQWEPLKDGIVLDPDHLNLTDYPGQRPAPDFPAITVNGTTQSAFKYLIFLPDRSLLQDESAQISLAEGVFSEQADGPTFTRPGENGPANYYRMTILATTGRTIIEQP